MDTLGSSAESKERFVEEIRARENELFPEFDGKSAYGAVNTNYYYYSPTYQVRHGLINEQDVTEFAWDKTKDMLSVGSGPAHLERLLTTMGVGKEQVVLSDIDLQDVPSDFDSVSFDMWEKWPNFDGRKFDLIIFPNSMFANQFDVFEERDMKFQQLICRAFCLLKPNGEIRINAHHQRTDETMLRLIRLAASHLNIEILFNENNQELIVVRLKQ